MAMRFEIKSRWSGEVLFSADCSSQRECAELAIKAGVDLTRANLSEAGLSGPKIHPRSLIMVDLDGVLWDGTLGEDGLAGLRITQAHRAFQEALLELKRAGVKLAILSRNNEAQALKAIKEHPFMVLRARDFDSWRIDWGCKASNARDLIEGLRLEQSLAVFVDDSPAERDLVRSVLPDVFVPEWPDNPDLFAQAVRRMGCFDRNELLDADLQFAGSVEEWLRRIGVRVYAEKVMPLNLDRVTKLFNKTNQLNLSTRRLSSGEILEWTWGPNREMLACWVTDKFGDSGLVGVFSVEIDGDHATLVDFILSCRVVGRKIEEAMLYLAVKIARARGAQSLAATYLPTEKNPPILNALKEAGLTEMSPNNLLWNCVEPYPKPRHIEFDLDNIDAEYRL